MIRDLNLSSQPEQACADFCVIGSGPAGLTVGRALAEAGYSVVIAEAGPRVPTPFDKPSELSFVRSEYHGATLGRTFGLGGTSAIWGGQLLPLRPEECATWPLQYQEIAPYYAKVESWVGVPAGAFEVSNREPENHPLVRLQWEGFRPRCSKWIAFRQRNFAKAWLPALADTGKVQIWLNAEVRGWNADASPDGLRIRKLVARSRGGATLTIAASTMVICAGALESARLVLELHDQCSATESPSHALVGRFLQDHLSTRIAEVEVFGRRGFAELFAPFFAGQTMRSPRLDLAPDATGTQHCPAAYLHFVVEAPERSGFSALRDTLRNVQAGKLAAAFRSSLHMLGALPEILNIAYWRILRKRLAFSTAGRVFLQLDFEQPQRYENRMYLATGSNADGRRGVAIDWDHECEVRQIVAYATARLQSFWATNQLDRIARLEFFDTAEKEGSLSGKPYDIYHPAGTTRMARSPVDGVVDPNLRVFGISNCYIASTAVFPSMGAANPTFTLMALALRLADHLCREKQSHRQNSRVVTQM